MRHRLSKLNISNADIGMLILVYCSEGKAMRKKVAWLLALIILMAIGVMIESSLKKQTKEVKQIEDAEDVERTNEEYISIFLENREDFDYVADRMNQWPERSSIHFESGILSKNQEITDEIENNEEFCKHLKNLYDLKEIYFVIVEGEKIAFYFSKPPKDYIGCFI